ncbi:DNA adenine methylase [Caloramator sp. mosi_1]|uniref:DNA adenine methylase n=1 Tax=Caloramator sp. mosi_1 TaxID=3023090 RepID=UPI0023607C54|nr:DNA adenine methylase [Caloramator sp. mosi_1]WDC85714.1 DNA adenine methylase [Caloramator sp. mosi_1]
MVYNKDVNELIREIEGDILYLDPPYNTRQYCANYHLLETIARYDNPEIVGKTGLRKDDNLKSKYCSKRTVEGVFEDLIANAKFKYIFLSYNNEGLMDLETIEKIMGKYGEYRLFTKENYKRFRADKKDNRNHKADFTIEYLHCLIK